jgi:uncharacterized protein YraI
MRRKVLIMLVTVLALLLAPMAATAATAPSPGEVQPEALFEETTATVHARWGLRLRVGPGLGQPVILVMRYGETVHITGDAVWQDGYSWVPVRYHRWGHTYEGYCASIYLTPAVPVPPPDEGLRVTAWLGLRLRWGPGTWYGIYTAVPYGTVLEPTGVYEWGGGIEWAQVQYHGHLLWAAAMYLTPV